MFLLFLSLAQQLSRMALEYNIKKLEQQRAKVLEAQATTDHKLKEAEEHKCKAEAKKEAKKAKKEEEKRVTVKTAGEGREAKNAINRGSIKQVILPSVPKDNDAFSHRVHHQDERRQRSQDVQEVHQLHHTACQHY